MALEDDFKRATNDVKELPAKPSNENLLKLYSLFKQATDGDVNGKRPGMLDIKGRAKFDAWKKISGLDSDSAKQQYISLVKELASG